MGFNVGGFDRLERIIHGIAFILIGIFLVSGAWRYVLGIYGLMRLFTGVFAFCPVYVPFKYTTRSGNRASRPGPDGAEYAKGRENRHDL